MANSAALFVLLPIFWILVSIPAYVVGSRIGVTHPGVAFIPAVGPYIVILHSIKRSGWLCLLAVIPLVNVVFVIWLAFTVPFEHGRTRLWALPLLIPGVTLIAQYAYAFTLDPSRRPVSPADGLGSAYHVPPLGDWRR